MFAMPLYGRFDIPLRAMVPGPWLAATPEQQSIEAAVNLLNQRAPEGRILTQSWATSVDLEYLMDGYLHFTNYKDPEAVRDRATVLLALNRRFVKSDDARLAKLLRRCEKTIYDVEPVLIKECTTAAMGEK
jgi:hypothetical protein